MFVCVVCCVKLFARMIVVAGLRVVCVCVCDSCFLGAEFQSMCFIVLTRSCL